MKPSLLDRLAESWRSWWQFVVVERAGYRRESEVAEALQRLNDVERLLNKLEVTLLYLKVRGDLHSHVEGRRQS